MKRKFILLILSAVTLFSCNGYFSSMDIDSTTSPDVDKVMSDPQNYPSLVSGAYNSMWKRFIVHDEHAQVSSNADFVTTAAGNWGISGFMYNYDSYKNGSGKPEIGNTDPNGGSLINYWNVCYTNISVMNNILTYINTKGLKYYEGPTDKTDVLLANCHFIIGMCYTELALYFDKGFIVKPETDVAKFTASDLKGYTELSKLAQEYLDKTIKLCDEKEFKNIKDLMPNNLVSDNISLGGFARFMAARSIAYLPRTKDEATDWAKVKTYLGSGKGLSNDIMINMPQKGWDSWSTALAAWAGYDINSEKVEGGQWVRLNMRIVQMMADQKAPADRAKMWPIARSFFAVNTENILQRVKSSDLRLNGTDGKGTNADFKYQSSHKTTAGVGYTSFTNYTNYSLYRGTEPGGPNEKGSLYCFMKAESDLLLSEAIFKTEGVTSDVVSLINNTRTVRGGLTDITTSSSAEQIKRALFYEKAVECGFAYQGVVWFERRKTDIADLGLTPFSFRQYPVPFKELKMLGEASYSYGGRLGVNIQEENTKYNYVPPVVE